MTPESTFFEPILSCESSHSHQLSVCEHTNMTPNDLNWSEICHSYDHLIIL